MLKFSLIIPIYNVEKFLPQCLDSVLNQDIPLNEYEIICVIDGSPDNCTSIVKKYQEKYNNIVLFEQENKGVSVARNKGIELSKGEYLWFIDSDDFIVANCLKYLYSELKENDYDKIIFNYLRCDEKTEYNKEVHNTNLICKEKYYDYDSACLMVVKKEIYNKYELKFNSKILYHEDVLFSFQLNELDLKSLKLDNFIGYIYRKRSDSIMEIKDLNHQRKKTNYLLLCAYEINISQNKFNRNKNYFYDADYQVFMLCTKALLSTFNYDRANYKNILNKAKQMEIYPYKFKRKLNFKCCKTKKQYLLEIFEYLICKNWFATLISKFC